jgi:hypothetical protein
MRHRRYPFLTALTCGALILSSTAAAAANPALPQPAKPGGWAALSMLTGAATAAQADAPQPPPPSYRDSSDTTLLLIGSTLVLAALLALALSHGHDDDNESLSPD